MIPRSSLGFTEWLGDGLRRRADRARALCVPAIAGLLIAIPAPVAAQAQVSPGLAARAADSGRVKVLVQLRVPFTPEARLSAAAQQDQRTAIATAQDAVAATLDGSTIKTYDTIPWMAADVTAAQLRALAAHPAVSAIDEDVLLRPALADSTTRINAHLIWQAGYEGTGWSVAVLDSGSESGHPFLVGKVTTEACFSTTFAGNPASTSFCPGQVPTSTALGSGAPCPSTTSGCDHGTHVAGIAVGRLNPTNQFGVARGANLVPIQVFSQFTDTATCSPDPAPCALAYSSDVIAGLNHVGVLAGAGNAGRIAAANLSLGSGSFSAVCDATTGMPPVKAAIDALAALGIATVAASGNNGSSSQISAPACISTAISVGSTLDSADSISSFSNRASFLSLMAPGSGINSSVPGGAFVTKSGTSMATAHVSGAWALVKSFQPGASVTQVLNALRNTGVAITDVGTQLTYSRIRLDTAFQSFNAVGPPGPPINLTAIVTGNFVQLSWEAPLLGSTPTNYLVEAGSAPGLSNLGIFAVGPARAFASLAPHGIYYVRVRAQNAFGTGPPSPEVVVVVGVGFTGTLMPPRDFRASFDGTVLSLNWNIATNAATPESYVIDLGTSPGQSNLGTHDLGSNRLSVTATNVLPGVYYARLRARIASVLSGFSNEVNFVITSAPPCHAAPFAPSALRANIIGNTLSLSWVPPLLSGVISSYVVEAGTSPGLANVLNFNTGSAVSVFSTPAPSGLYWVRVRAVNACGVSLPSGEILVTVP
jgi:hypothetical protein